MFTKEGWLAKIKEVIYFAKERDFFIHQQFTSILAGKGFLHLILPGEAHPIEIGKFRRLLVDLGACEGKHGALEIGLFDTWIVAYF